MYISLSLYIYIYMHPSVLLDRLLAFGVLLRFLICRLSYLLLFYVYSLLMFCLLLLFISDPLLDDALVPLAVDAHLHGLADAADMNMVCG